jgi:hypothetical protein
VFTSFPVPFAFNSSCAPHLSSKATGCVQQMGLVSNALLLIFVAELRRLQGTAVTFFLRLGRGISASHFAVA